MKNTVLLLFVFLSLFSCKKKNENSVWKFSTYSKYVLEEGENKKINKVFVDSLPYKGELIIKSTGDSILLNIPEEDVEVGFFCYEIKETESEFTIRASNEIQEPIFVINKFTKNAVMYYDGVEMRFYLKK